MERVVAITFDDGPNPKITPLILKVLKEKDVKATFFLIGWLAEQYPDVVKQIIQEGHSVGNHTYNHHGGLPDLLNDKGEEAVREEVQKGDAAVRKVAGFSQEQPLYFRPPGLAWDERVEAIVRPIYGDRIFKTGLCGSDYNWNDNNGNWPENDPNIAVKAQLIIDDVKAVAEPRSVLVVALHDSSEYGVPGQKKQFTNWTDRAYPTLQALPGIIDYLREQDWTITTLDKLDLSAVD